MSLPEDLRSAILDTTVISSHGSADTTNFTSTDKLYLLGGQEIYGASVLKHSWAQYDTARNNERQLDYYLNKGTTTSSYSAVIKKYNGSNYDWWRRTTDGINNSLVYYVNSSGAWATNAPSNTYGVSPAFRIG